MTAITNIPALLSASQNSIIGLILQILLEQDFAPIEASPPKEGDQKIGEITNLERAIYTAHLKKIAQLEEKKTAFNSTEQEYEVGAHKKISIIQDELDDLYHLFWESVRYRLTSLGFTDFQKLQLRPDGSIIAVTPDENDKPRSGTLVIRIRA